MVNKFIFEPVTNWKIHQQFGENNACIDLATGKKTITCDGLNPPKGYKSVYSKMKGHNGVDVQAGSWERCYAPQTGIVAEISTEEDRGLGVGIITKDKYFCIETGKKEHFHIRCWHFWANAVTEGQEVKVGDLIGYCGSTGYSSGVHLHLELKPVKVTWRSGKIKSWTNILQDNGFYGAVNPLPYVENINAVKFAGLWKQTKEVTAKVAEFIADKLRK